MTGYAKRVSKHRRLTILKFLKDSPEYTSNASILEDVCNSYGVASSRDEIIGEIEWLRSKGFVTCKGGGDFIVATATSLGVDVAQGKARHDHVQRPRPGE